MSTLSYKDYTGTIEYSNDDDCLFGRIIGINDIITYEGQSLAEIKTAFQESVDDYLAYCAEAGKKPNKSYSGKFVLRIEPSLHASVATKAEQSGISLNQYVSNLLASV